MGFRRVVLLVTVAVAISSYWLYAPLPPGYSMESRLQFQKMMAVFKMIKVASVIGSLLGYGSFVELYRNIGNKVVKDYGPKANVEGVVTGDSEFDGIPVRIYTPVDSQNETFPGIVFYHSGGFTYGSIDTSDIVTTRLCRDIKSVVVSVDYRLAPEFPFPSAVDDSLKATKYFLLHAADFNVDAKRLALAGDSAGGNLATAVSMKLRDEGFPIPIKLQVLIYPWIQSLDFDLPSMIQNEHGPFLTREMITFFTAMNTDGNEDRLPAYTANRHVIKSFREKISKTFLILQKLPKEFLKGYERPDYPEGDEKIWNEIKDKLLDPFHSPLTAENLENLPEAFILTANYDPLRDEGYLYGIRLKESKNKVTLYNAEIGFHCFANFLGVIPEVESMFAVITKFLLEHL